MACCSEYQNECLRVITIKTLRDFVDGKIQDSAGASVSISHRLGDKYCPTYGDLTGGTIIQNWVAGGTPISDQDGIIVNPICVNSGQRYNDNQLVDQKDLSMMYTRFKSFSVSNSLGPNEKVGQCGDYVGLGFTHKYDRYTKSMDSSCIISTTSAEVDDLALSNVRWSEECDWVSVDGSVPKATIEKQPETRTAPERCCIITGTVVFRTASKTASTEICQSELTGDYTHKEGRHYSAVTAVAATETEFGCCGGTYGITGTGYYFDRFEWVDTCERIYHDEPYLDVPGQEAIGGCEEEGCSSCQINGDTTIGEEGGTIQLTANESIGCGCVSCQITGPTTAGSSEEVKLSVREIAGGGYAKSGSFSPCDCCNDTSDCCDGCSDSDSLSIEYHGFTSNSVPFSQSCSSKSSGCYSPDPPGPDTGDTGTTGSCKQCTTCSSEKVGSDCDWIYDTDDVTENADGSISYTFKAATHYYCSSPSRDCPYCPDEPTCMHFNPITVACGDYVIVGDITCRGGTCP